MKKVITTIVVASLITTSLIAGTAVKHFTKQNNSYVGGIIGNQLIYIYKNNKGAEIKDPTILWLAAKKTATKLCKKPEVKKLINKGLKIIFIYPNNKLTETTIMSIDSCKK